MIFIYTDVQQPVPVHPLDHNIQNPSTFFTQYSLQDSHLGHVTESSPVLLTVGATQSQLHDSYRRRTVSPSLCAQVLQFGIPHVVHTEHKQVGVGVTAVTNLCGGVCICVCVCVRLITSDKNNGCMCTGHDHPVIRLLLYYSKSYRTVRTDQCIVPS